MLPRGLCAEWSTLLARLCGATRRAFGDEMSLNFFACVKEGHAESRRRQWSRAVRALYLRLVDASDVQRERS